MVLCLTAAATSNSTEAAGATPYMCRHRNVLNCLCYKRLFPRRTVRAGIPLAATGDWRLAVDQKLAILVTL